jgi:hypothetical protein
MVVKLSSKRCFTKPRSVGNDLGSVAGPTSVKVVVSPPLLTTARTAGDGPPPGEITCTLSNVSRLPVSRN